MSIKAICPACGTQAIIDKTLYGKKLRCANEKCRSMFRYHESGESELIELQEKATPQSADWSQAPPPVKSGKEADWLSAPPPSPGSRVRYQDFGTAPSAQEAEVVTAQVVEDGVEADEEGHVIGDYSYGKPKSKGLPIFLGLLVVMVIIAGVAGYMVFSGGKANLANVLKEADSFIIKRNWNDALQRLELVKKKMTDAKTLKDIDFKIEWCNLNVKLEGAKDVENIRSAVDGVVSFNQLKKSDPLIKDLRKGLFDSTSSLGKQFSESVKADPKDDDLTRADKLVNVLKDHAESVPEKETAAKAIADAEGMLGNLQMVHKGNIDKGAFLKRLNEVNEAQDLSRLEEIQQNYDELVKKHKFLGGDAGLKDTLSKLRSQEIQWIKLSKTGKKAGNVDGNQNSRSIGVAPAIKTPGNATDNQDIVLSMGRGTLYGLSSRTGEVKWILPVGPDLQELPPRLSIGPGQNDVLFVVTSESDGKNARYFVNAVDVTNGKKFWAQELITAQNTSQPCVAGVTLINGLLYIPLVDGTVNVVEAKDGIHNGFYYLGAKLTVPPTWDSANNRLFIPADKRRIFVLDLKANAKQACPGVIYTDHMVGGIRAPVYYHRDSIAVAISSGNGTSEVQIYSVPKDVTQSKVEKKISIPGHIWFAPYLDRDTLGFLSDSDQICLLGLNQGDVGKESFTSLSAKALPVAGSTGNPSGRSQIAHVVLGDWWIITNGKLVRNHFDPLRNKMVELPTDAAALGSPLHAPTISPDGRYVVLVTQTKDQALATAIDRSTAKVVWQRQLGLVPSQDPIALASRIAVLDKGGGVFLYDYSAKKNDAPLTGGSWPAAPTPGSTNNRLIRVPGSQDVINVSYDPIKELIRIRRITVQGESQNLGEYKIPFAPSGEAACDGESLLLPCRDGKINVFKFGSTSPGTPLTWRDPEALPSALGHLTMISSEMMTATDGLRKLLRFERPPGGNWRRVNGGEIEFPGRIISIPVAVGTDSVALADETNTIHLITLLGIASRKEFPINGAIRRGPFAMDDKIIGCIFSARDEKSRETQGFWWMDISAGAGNFYKTMGIVGTPVIIDSNIILAEWKKVDENSTLHISLFSWIDKTSGKVVRAEILPRGLAPASGVVKLPDQSAFAPLSDGTVRLLSANSAQAATK